MGVGKGLYTMCRGVTNTELVESTPDLFRVSSSQAQAAATTADSVLNPDPALTGVGIDLVVGISALQNLRPCSISGN